MRTLWMAASAWLLMPALAVADSVPTVEEQALAALLAGDTSRAINLLEAASSEDPSLKWIAGRVALEAGRHPDAWHLFEGEALNSLWGRIDLSMATGDVAGAVSTALSELERTLSGQHREALALRLVSLARDQVTRAPERAAIMLQVALELEVSPQVQKAIEDALFSLPGAPSTYSPETLTAARHRITRDPQDLLASRVVGEMLAPLAPDRALVFLRPVLENAPEEEALRAASAVSTLSTPPAVMLEASDILLRRFKESRAVHTQCLEIARRVVGADPSLADPALGQLMKSPFVSDDASILYAQSSDDPRQRYQRWLALADLEGASALGRRARQIAQQTLLEIVLAAPEGLERRRVAQEVLKSNDGLELPLVQYYALEDQENRLEDLWDLAERFPGAQMWCQELSLSLVSRGVSLEDARRYGDVCPNPSSPAGQALHTFAAEENVLVLLPRDDGLDVLVGGDGPLQVSEHQVDPEALYRASEGAPLDTPLDAFLMAPDEAYDLPLEPDRLIRLPLSPRTPHSLLSITVRLDDLQASSLITPHPLKLNAVLAGDCAGLGVLSHDTPVAGATVFVQDGSGEVLELSTDTTGTLLLENLSGTVRLMALKDDALGFLELEGAQEVPETIEQFELVFWDRGLSHEGSRASVSVFGARSDGSVEETVILRSLSPKGSLLDEVTVELLEGSASARLWLQGNGQLLLLRGDELLASSTVPPASPPDCPPVRVLFDPISPTAGGTMAIRLLPILGPARETEPITVRISSPWAPTREERIQEGGQEVRLELDLRAAAPGESVTVALETPSGSRTYTANISSVAPPAAPTLPPIIGVGQALKLEPLRDGFYLAEEERGYRKRYFPSSEPLAFPSPGLWWVSAVTPGARGPRTPIAVQPAPGSVDERGIWRGTAPALAVDTQERVTHVRFLRPGDSVRLQPVRGAKTAWTVLSPIAPKDTSLAPTGGLMLRLTPPSEPPSLTIPYAGPPDLTLQVEGVLEREVTSKLILGAGLPPGTVLWAFLTDGSDRGSRHVAPLQEPFQGMPGELAVPAAPSPIFGTPIQVALLEEEERLAEQAPPQVIPMEQMANELLRSEIGGLLGGMGYGSGGGGYAQSQLHGLSGGGVRLRETPPPFDEKAIAVLEGISPGPVSVTVPAHIAQAHILLVARTLEGRWVSRSLFLPVGGSSLKSQPLKKDSLPPPGWDGNPQGLLELALSLPPDPRAHALAALKLASVPEAAVRLTMLTDAGLEGGPGAAMAQRLLASAPTPQGDVLERLAALPDPAHYERVVTALEAAALYPERAAAAARRLLREKGLEPWVVARAALVLWVARDGDAASAAQGKDVYAAAARAVISSTSDPSWLPDFWRIARDPLALPADRALMIHALSLHTGIPVAPTSRPETRTPINVRASPPLARLEGRTLPRGPLDASHPWVEGEVSGAPAERFVPLEIELPAWPLPTRIACQSTGTVTALTPVLEIAPSSSARKTTCTLRTTAPGMSDISVTWHSPSGDLMGMGGVTLEVEPARDSRAGDAMSPLEQYHLGLILARRGDAEGISLLKTLLKTDWLGQGQVAEASLAVLEGVRQQKDAAALIDAFDACRERTPNAALDLEVAAEVAKAYARQGDAKRAVNAVLAVLDVRFMEELGAIREIQKAQLTATGLELLEALLQRYPEVPTVIQARYLAPSMLLSLAEQPEVVKASGLTRASMRHTAVAGLSRFLLIHGKTDVAPEAASLLMGTLHRLRDPAREQALAGLLSKTYRHSPVAWRLSVSEARAAFDRGKYTDAARILEELSQARSENVTGAIPDDAEATLAIALELGRTYEAQGHLDLALEQYARAGGSEEAAARVTWLERKTLELPSLLVVKTDEPLEVKTSLPAGMAVEMTAYRISLEQLLLRDGGEIRSSQVRVDGLHPEKTRSTKTNVRGDIGLPKVGPGAFLVAARAENATYRTVLIRTEGTLRVQSGIEGQRLIHLTDLKGKPIADARLWLFDAAGKATALRTDNLGAAFVPQGASYVRILAKWGTQYAFLELPISIDDDSKQLDMDWNAPAMDSNQMLLEQNRKSYEGLFKNEGKQRIDASML